MEGTWFWGNKSTIISRSGGAGTNYVSIWMNKKKYLSGGRNGMADATKAAPKAEDELDSLVSKQESDVICGAVDMLRNLNIGAKPAEVDEGALAGSGKGTEQVEVDKQVEVDERALAGSGNDTKKLEVDEGALVGIGNGKFTSAQAVDSAALASSGDSKCTSDDTSSQSSMCIISKKANALRNSELQPTRKLPQRTRKMPLRYRE